MTDYDLSIHAHHEYHHHDKLFTYPASHSLLTPSLFFHHSSQTHHSHIIVPDHPHAHKLLTLHKQPLQQALLPFLRPGQLHPRVGDLVIQAGEEISYFLLFGERGKMDCQFH